MDNWAGKLFSFLLSLVFYFGVIAFLTFYLLHQEKFQKIAIKEQAIDVVVLEEPKKRPLPKPPAPKSSQKPQPKNPGSLTPKHRPSIQELFAGVKVASRKRTPAKPKPLRPSRLKGRDGKKAKELLKKLHIKEYVAKRSIKSIDGKEDAYLQKVYKILYSYWAPSQQSAGSSAVVKIFIDRWGNFRYEIVRLSGNDLFDREFRNYLETLREVTFPKPKRDRTIVVRFKATD